MNDTQLNPCVICNGEAEIYRVSDKTYAVQCESCRNRVTYYGTSSDTVIAAKRKAIHKWNTLKNQK